MRRIWAGEPPFEGADPVGPPPVQPGGPPLVAGVLGPKGIARAARWAVGVDGAWTLDGDRDAMAAVFDADPRRVGATPAAPSRRTCRRASGTRSATTPRRSCAATRTTTWGSSAKGSGSAPPRRTCFAADALRQAVDNARDAGADEFFLVPTTADPDELAPHRATRSAI